MAEASLHGSDLDYESSTSPPKRRKTTDKASLSGLDAKWQGRFDSLTEKIDNMATLFSTAKTDNITDTGTSGARRPHVTPANEASVSREDDVISLQPGQDEISRLGIREILGTSSEDSSEVSIDLNNNRNSNIDVQRHKNLRDIFGEDADSVAKDSMKGIVLDESQIATLSHSWRSVQPDNLTAYKDEYRLNFPVSDKSTEILSVPSLDPLTEDLLVNKYGPKAASSGKNVSLYSNPVKSLEKLAYQGQLAARYGIITTAYLQQALGGLLEELQKKDTNMDRAVQTVRDIFAMSSKSMDQVARAGAYHHLIRRKATLEDTGLAEIKDIRSKIMGLPLTEKGVFGDQLENKLKERAEKNKQLKELLPEMDRSKSKRKYSQTFGQSHNNDFQNRNKPYQNQYRSNNNSYNQKSNSSGYGNNRSATYSYNNTRQSPQATETKPLGNFRIPRKQQQQRK